MPTYSLKEIMEFLNQLHANNNRQWFAEHKSEFRHVQQEFNEFVKELISGISTFDPSVTGLTPSDCTYRIYRDVRFSDDKSPYKTHFGAFIAKGGKKSGYMGYYVHISMGGEAYPHCHMIAAGDYCCDAKVLQVVREDILDGEGDFHDIVTRVADSRFVLDRDNSLKRNPKGFPEGAPWSEYLRLKNYCLVYMPDNNFMLSQNPVERIVELLRTTKPFVDYVNRAIEYVRGGGF